MNAVKVGLLVGSLRKDSYTRKIAKALIALAPKPLDCSIIEIGDLPLYNEDLDKGDAPGPWTRFRSELKKQGAILFLTPEYNRSVPGCLKNAIDVGSRPEKQSVFDGLPGAVVSVTPYKMGGFGANHALRQSFVFLNMPLMQQPEAYIGGAAELFDEKGMLKNEESRIFLANFMSSFAHWIETIDRRASPGDFNAFMQRRREAASAYVSGDVKPLESILPANGEATFFPPTGGSVHGLDEVAARYDRDAQSFSAGGSSTLELLQSGAEGDLAFWTGFQIAEARMGGRGKTVRMKLRITEVFRFGDGGWKLVHRHADPVAEDKNEVK